MVNKINILKEDLQATFLETGDLYEFMANETMINQLQGNVLDGSLNQIYLRIFTEDRIQSFPLIGSNSKSEFAYTEKQLTWKGNVASVSYRVDFQLGAKNTWFWTVQISGHGQVDLIYGQDLGLAVKGAVTSNEAYVSQYIDHHITKQQGDIVVSSRQNQSQKGQFPLVEQGSLQPLRAFSTDGYQFFGRSYKATNEAAALTKEVLDDTVYQYEFGFTALQTETLQLSDQPQEVVFYGVFYADQPTAVEKPRLEKVAIRQLYRALVFEELTNGKIDAKNLGVPLVGVDFTKAEIDRRFPEQHEVERVDDEIYSFFSTDYHHVVLKQKEVAMERSHGHILLSGNDLEVDRPVMSTTVYMYGLFNSQIVLGNTNMNRLMTNSRNALNTMKYSGQRLYLLREGKWRLLTLPSAFEMGLNQAKWYYKLTDDVLTVTTYTLNDTREIRLEVTSERGHSYTWALSNQLVMGPVDQPSYKLHQKNQKVTITADETSVISGTYPDLTYYMVLDQPFTLTDGRLLTNQVDRDLVVFKIDETKHFILTIQGSLNGKSFVPIKTDEKEEERHYLQFINDLLGQFDLRHDTIDVERFNLLARWYTHNMLVHFLSPHGLEQYGGAAWGTRDVSQGPTEYFLAMDRPEVVRSIICHLFSNQFEEDGNWPQWFMFDRYETIKADESHGDIIVWPLKVVTDYLAQTGDFAILDEQLPYTKRTNFAKTDATYSLYEHVQKEIAYIEANFLEGTYLSCYGDGDWDDTLQPNDPTLKKKMASSWTVALTYQVLNKFCDVITSYDTTYSAHVKEMVTGIRRDYDHYLLATDTLPGFVYMETPEKVELMVHPDDTKTGVHYRLLPMQRSMIAELLTPEQVDHHLALIDRYLKFPDGVRLMDRPAPYQGGVSTNFKRAEQSANFGREIGLQYVHAHIRYTEAMAKIGRKEEAWHDLEIINPIGIRKEVPNAALRQANVYFSSSDGDFKTRYEAQKNFDKLREGNIAVKGGWRIYSSGPGIYLNQLVTNVLGIRQNAAKLIFDPVLPEELNGLSLRFTLLKLPVTIHFYAADQPKIVVDGVELTFEIGANPYRMGAIEVDREALAKVLQKNSCLEIYK